MHSSLRTFYGFLPHFVRSIFRQPEGLPSRRTHPFHVAAAVETIDPPLSPTIRQTQPTLIIYLAVSIILTIQKPSIYLPSFNMEL
jgi:hypothetical protein